MSQSMMAMEREEYIPRMPPLLRGAFNIEHTASQPMKEDKEEIQSIFPHLFEQPGISIVQNRGEPVVVGHTLKVGVLFAGGPAPGGHNVICGLHDHLIERNIDSKVYGFLNGTSGLIRKEYIELTSKTIQPFRNLGGFHMLGSDRTKLETEEDFKLARQVATDMNLDGLVFVGGYDTNSNAMYAAENFAANGIRTKVISAPSTVDGDLRNEHMEASLGFDTVSKLYAELISNLGIDATSAKKTYHFCRVMGRNASHVALEVALETRPNLCLIGEEVLSRNKHLKDITKEIADLICERAEAGKNYGLIVMPEGLVEFVPDLKDLIHELSWIIRSGISDEEEIIAKLPAPQMETYKALPPTFALQLLFDRDPHGNCQVSRTEVERLLMETVKIELGQRKAKGKYRGKFNPIGHYFGYEGRCALPTNFDCNYGYVLGHTAAALVECGCSGYASSIRNLAFDPEKWICGGYPLSMMMHIEDRRGRHVARISRQIVDLNSVAFRVFAEQRDRWRLSEDYRTSGPIQHSSEMADTLNFTLRTDLFN